MPIARPELLQVGVAVHIFRSIRAEHYAFAKKHCYQRAGLCAGVELAFRPPGTAAWLFDKVK